MTLPPFPVDDSTLGQLEHALKGVYSVAPDGTHTLVGADFDVHQLLDFLSGYDSARRIPTDVPNVFEYPDAIYSLHDVIEALIVEVRRLRDNHIERVES